MSLPKSPGVGDITVRSGDMRLPIWLSGHGVPLVFLHGLGSDARDSRRDLGDLPGVRLAVADQRGHGRAVPALNPGQFDLDSLVTDLRAIMRGLRWPDPVVGGGSMGAAVALRYVLSLPSYCRALVLVAPALAAHPPAAGGMLADIADRIDLVGLPQAVRDMRRSWRDASPPVAQPASAADADSFLDGVLPAPEDGLDSWLRQDGRSLAIALRAVQSWRPVSSMSELENLHLPVTIVGIRDDALHPLELAIEMHRLIAGSHLEIIDSPARARVPGVIGDAVLRGLARLGILQRTATNW